MAWCVGGNDTKGGAVRKLYERRWLGLKQGGVTWVECNRHGLFGF